MGTVFEGIELDGGDYLMRIPGSLGDMGEAYDRFDSSWCAAVIYSFKNDRARDILFKIITNSSDSISIFPLDTSLADWAVFYLPLLPNSAELLPKIKSLLEGNITQEQTIRLTHLARALEFNGKIPTEERERFDTVRRELALSWSLGVKDDLRGKIPEAGMDDRFSTRKDIFCPRFWYGNGIVH
jgi:hypothetical protein